MKPKKGDKGETKTAVKVPALVDQTLLTDIRDLIHSARRRVAQAVNAELTMLYWEIGHRIRPDILEEKRAAYGKEIVAALRRQLGWTHFKSLIPIEDRLSLSASQGGAGAQAARGGKARPGNGCRAKGISGMER